MADELALRGLGLRITHRAGIQLGFERQVGTGFIGVEYLAI